MNDALFKPWCLFEKGVTWSPEMAKTPEAKILPVVEAKLALAPEPAVTEPTPAFAPAAGEASPPQAGRSQKRIR